MFKRLREGLFGRPEDDLPQEEAATVQAEPAERAADEQATEPLADEQRQMETGEASPLPSTVPAPSATPADRVEPAVDVRPHLPGPQPLAPSVTPVPGPGASITTDQAARGEPEPSFTDEEQIIPERQGLFRNPFKLSLGRTRQLFERMGATLEEAEDITEELWDELEETLITSDVGVQTTERLLETLRERVRAEGLTHGAELRDALKDELILLLGEPESLAFSDTSPITVILVVGVNGVGKTTSIAKLANLLKRQKHRVLLAAGDTFRAAATEQIKMWGERIGVPVISQHQNADAAAVVYDAMQAAQARGSDVLIVDTAGRLHTKFNLMEELKKILRVLQKYDPEAPHDVLLVIDATTGQNGFLQAKQFVQDSGVSGVILTKLDGTARGGIAFAVASELGLPIKYIGTGERVNDIEPFDAEQFVDALFDEG